MRKVPCCDPAEIGRVLELPSTDPRRRHLDECPRCRALALSYGDFVEPGPVPAGARPAEAAARLSEALAGITAEPEPPASCGSPVRCLGRWLRRAMAAPWPRPALAAAAAVVAVAGAALLGYLTDTPPRPALRGPGSAALSLAPAEAARSGAATLRWRPLADAEAYQVRFYSTALVEVARLAPVPETTVVVGPRALPDSLPAGTVLLWRVAALRGGDEIALSPVGTLRVP